MALEFSQGLAGKTAEEKAQEYNSLLGQGYSDADIRSAANAAFGNVGEGDWSYLTGLASQMKPVSNVADQTVASPLNQVSAQSPDTTETIQVSTPSNEAILDALTKQILGSSNTAAWTGQGFGSPEKNAADMARILNQAGITDIGQLGVKDVTIPGVETSDESGTYTTPETKAKEYYNKLTGATVGEDRTGWKNDVFGRTFAGSGSTNYGVQFDPATGKPLFYTQYGGSTSDLGSVAPLLSVASLIPGVAPFAMAANAALAAKQGNMLGALASAAGIPGVSDVFSPALVSGLQTANQASNLYNAVQSGNLLGALTSGAALTGAGGLGSTKIGDTNISVSDAMKYANLAKAVASNDPSAITKAISLMTSAAKADTSGGITNRIYDPATGGPSSQINLSSLSEKSLDDFNTLVNAGLDPSDAFGVVSSFGGPSGINLAAADTGTISDAGGGLLAEITGTPITAEDPRSAKLRPPAGYSVASGDDPAMQEPARYDDNDNILPKSDGTYYDITQNAWFKPTGEFDTSGVTDYSDMFGDKTLPEGFSVSSEGPLGEDIGANVSEDGTLGDIDFTLGTTPSDSGEMVITAKRPEGIEITDGGDSADTDTIRDEIKSVVGGDGGIGSIDGGEGNDSVYGGGGNDSIIGGGGNDSIVGADGNDTIKGGDGNDVVKVADETKTTTTTPTTTAKTSGTTKTTSTAATPAATTSTPFDTKFLEVKNPWLVTKRTPLKGVEEKELKQIYDRLDPDLKEALMPKSKFKEDEQLAAIRESLDPELAAMLGYAGGGTADSFSALSAFQDSMKEGTPKFVKYTSPGFLTSGSGKKSPIQMQELPQMQLGKKMARGGLPSKYAEAAPDGHDPEFITGVTGYYAGGRGTGQSDDIPAMLHDGDYVMDAEAVSALGDGSSKAGKDVLSHFMGQVPHRDGADGKPVPAKIADGEFVLPAAFVTALGGGDNKHGANLLDEMREKLRMHKRSAPTSKIPPKAKSPLDYLKGVKG